MSLMNACGWSSLRAAAIVLAAAPVCVLLARVLGDKETRFFEQTEFLGAGRTYQRLAWTLLLIPFLTPDLLLGYAYGNFSPFPLVRHPWMCELLYGVLLWMKLVPLGAVVMFLTPPAPLTAKAIHCRRLLFAARPKGFSTYAVLLGDFIRGPARRMFPALGLIFLLAFQEFELGALLGITAGRVGSPVSWTRTLFEGQQGIIDPLAPLKWTVWPVLFDLAVLVPLVWLISRSRNLTVTTEHGRKPLGRIGRLSAWCYFATAIILVSVIPLVCVLRESTGGYAALLASREQLTGLSREIFVGCVFAGVAAVAAYFMAAIPLMQQSGQLLSNPSAGGCHWRVASASRWILATRQWHPFRLLRYSAALLLIPGLTGSLIVGLSILYLFQTGWLNSLYDTPAPLGIALVLFLAPRALLLQLLFRATRPRESGWLAQLLSRSAVDRQRRTAGQLLWSIERSRHFWATALLAFWAYWDLTSAVMLHPSSMVPASVRLYNLMHYGHNAVLSSMTLLAVAIPLLLAWFFASLLRPLTGRLV
jgi:hypothetical protein